MVIDRFDRVVQPWRPRTHVLVVGAAVACVAVAVVVFPLVRPRLTHGEVALLLGQAALTLVLVTHGFRLLLRRVWAGRDAAPLSPDRGPGNS